MSQVPSLLDSGQTGQTSGQLDTLNELDVDVFLKLLITELQNQDPLNPLDNSEMLAQINQIREIGATDKLTNTLDSVLLGQNISSATSLIGADVDAISNTNEKVSGRVSRVSIENGRPQLELDLTTQATPQLDPGNVEAGTYSYRVVWQTDNGLQGIELSGEEAVSTITGLEPYPSIKLSNLPITDVPKQIYRTDHTGEGDYYLAATILDGTKSTFLDKASDDELSQTRQTEPFKQDPKYRIRNFKINLNNVASIRPPE